MQLSAYADPASASWDVAVDGLWLADGPADHPTVTFEAFDPSSVDSARLVAVWLDNGERFTLTALRPSGAKGQDRDAVSTTIPPADPPLSVFDPRLSIEYAADGTPQRFGIELWLGTDPEADQRPLRIGGEVTPGPDARLGGPRRHGPVLAQPMTAHSGDQAGLAVLALVTR